MNKTTEWSPANKETLDNLQNIFFTFLRGENIIVGNPVLGNYMLYDKNRQALASVYFHADAQMVHLEEIKEGTQIPARFETFVKQHHLPMLLYPIRNREWTQREILVGASLSFAECYPKQY